MPVTMLKMQFHGIEVPAALETFVEIAPIELMDVLAHGSSDDIFTPISEDAHRRRVPFRDASRRIGQNDRYRRRADQRLQLSILAAQFMMAVAGETLQP